MKKLVLGSLCIIILVDVHAQAQKQGNSSLDSLKQSVKAVGNLFKKAAKINIKISDINNNDQNLAMFLSNLQRVPGVMNTKQGFEAIDAIIAVSYKGKSSDLWEAIPQSSKQVFTPVMINDSLIDLSYKYARKSQTPVTTGSAANPSNQNDSKQNQTGNKTQAASLSKGAAMLFNNVQSKLSIENKNAIYKMLAFRISKDGKQFTLDDNDAADFPFEAFVYPTDLNKDGVEEIFVIFGNTFTSGNTGSSVVAYIPNKTGTFTVNFGFSGATPYVLPTSNFNYPDLLIGGPGFTWPVWRWNGKEYDFYKEQAIDEKSFEKLKTKNLEDLSKAYQASLK